MSPIWLKGSLKTIWPTSNNTQITDSKQNIIAFIDGKRNAACSSALVVRRRNIDKTEGIHQ
jgi:hypothetical protein